MHSDAAYLFALLFAWSALIVLYYWHPRYNCPLCTTKPRKCRCELPRDGGTKRPPTPPAGGAA